MFFVFVCFVTRVSNTGLHGVFFRFLEGVGIQDNGDHRDSEDDDASVTQFRLHVLQFLGVAL